MEKLADIIVSIMAFGAVGAVFCGGIVVMDKILTMLPF